MSDTPHEARGAAAIKDESSLLDVLRLLIDTKKAKTTADLLKYATQFGAPEAEERLLMMEAEGIPMGLAFDAISVHIRILAHKRNGALLTECRGKQVGLVLPLPPHVPQLFLPVAEVTFLQPEEGPAHGSLHEYTEHAVKGARACRTKAQSMEVLVFEAFRDGAKPDGLFVDASVADALEPKMLPAGVKLIAHLRPHRNPRDIPFHFTGDVSFI
ncbi:MAG: hypothetical protein ABI600_20595 [Luteolibacter sp.]